jgi:hypothetical protein
MKNGNTFYPHNILILHKSGKEYIKIARGQKKTKKNVEKVTHTIFNNISVRYHGNSYDNNGRSKGDGLILT